MTTDNKPRTEPEPTVIHWLGSMSITTRVSANGLGDGVVTNYGDEMVLTRELRTVNEDRNGRCVFDLLDDEPAQVAKWGRVLLRRGPWPGGLRLEAGSPEFVDAAEAARKQAWKIENREDREKALAAVKELYGRPPLVSRTFQTYPPSEAP